MSKLLREVFEALYRLEEHEKAYIMGYFGIYPDMKKFSEKVRWWLQEAEKRE